MPAAWEAPYYYHDVLRPRSFGQQIPALPRHIPKFEETHAETQFDRECASLNPLTPARQSGNWRLCIHKSEKCPPIGAFCRSVLRLWMPNSDNLSANSSIVSG